MDRRIYKTREAIIKAFVGLMAEKNFEQITINEIAERANVNRGTVYLHYTDKFDLLDQCIETHLVQLFESCLDEDATHFPSKDSLLHTFEYLEQHAFLYATLLVNKGVPAFRNRLMVLIQQRIVEEFAMRGCNGKMNQEMLVQFLASGIVGIMEWWITHSMPCPATEMVDQLWSLLERMQMIPQTEGTTMLS